MSIVVIVVIVVSRLSGLSGGKVDNVMFNYTAIRLGDLVIFNIFMAGFRNNLDSDNHEMRGSMTVIRQISPRGLAGLQWSDVRLPGTVKSPKHWQHLEEFMFAWLSCLSCLSCTSSHQRVWCVRVSLFASNEENPGSAGLMPSVTPDGAQML